ncbi:hypothetical protein [Actinoplanes sp. NPDC026623]|uniref:hypothetical protein n=1 Tax=Actinoplanes sp. NPDC026623 TaxID=3155610 RepID=UPI00340CC9E4
MVVIVLEQHSGYTGPCTMIGMTRTATLNLAKPLGDRDVLTRVNAGSPGCFQRCVPMGQVVRLRHDGITDPPTDTLTLLAPVVIGGGERTWRRHLLIDYTQKNHLIKTYAEVTFNDVDGHERTNRWPRATRRRLDAASTPPPTQ